MAADIILTTPATTGNARTYSDGSVVNLGGTMRKFTVSYLDMIRLGQSVAGTNYIALKYLPQGSVLTYARVKHSVQFLSGSSLSLVASVVTAASSTLPPSAPTIGSVTASAAAHTVVNASVTGVAVGTTEGTGLTSDLTGGIATPFSSTASTIPLVALRVVTTTAGANNLTQGSLDVWFDYVVMG